MILCEFNDSTLKRMKLMTFLCQEIFIFQGLKIGQLQILFEAS